MKFFYITNARIPTEKANGIQILKMSEALSSIVGVSNYTLILPNRVGSLPCENSKISTEVCRLYGLKLKFKTKLLPVIDFLKLTDGLPGFLDDLAYSLEVFSFAVSALFVCFRERPDIIYTRDFPLLPFLLLLGKPIFYETHFFPTTKVGIIAHQILIPLLAGVVVINNQFPSFYDKFGIRPRRMLVSHNGADPDFFQKIDSAQVQKLKKKLGIKLGDIVVGYIGRLSGAGQDKGKQLLLTALVSIAKKFHQTRFLIVGEKSENLASFSRVVPKRLRPRFIFAGVVPYNQIPQYFNLLDVGVIPFPEKEHFKYFMSPLKLFDYLAAGVPIVTSDFPPLREIINEKNAVFVEPGNPDRLARGVSKLVGDVKMRKKMRKENKLLASYYTWDNRVKKIIDFIYSSTQFHLGPSIIQKTWRL